MAGLLSKVAKFAQSPQGRKLADRAKEMANDPKNKQKIEEFRKRGANKRSR